MKTMRAIMRNIINLFSPKTRCLHSSISDSGCRDRICNKTSNKSASDTSPSEGKDGMWMRCDKFLR